MEGGRATAAYCRVSTLEQKRRGYGIDIQVRDVRIFAERHGVFVQRFYKDEGESGVHENRRALRRLLRDCRNGKIQTIILPSLDRLSRDVRIGENLFHDFARLGAEVLIADMPTYNGRDRKDIIERLWKGRQERVRRGRPAGGNVAYGYRRNGTEGDTRDLGYNRVHGDRHRRREGSTS